MKTDTLIIGCGIAGATAALRLSENPQHHVTVITRAPKPEDSNTAWAQGGIVTRGLDDAPQLLVDDILHAGAGLSSLEAAKILAEEGPELVQSVLIDRCGVQFDRQPDGELVYGLEAAHSTRRIVHVGDKTGHAIAVQLIQAMLQVPNIQLLTSHTAIDLLMSEDGCIGVTILDETNGEFIDIHAGQTIIATGGVGQVYQNTTNPIGARGDGLAMAWRAGAAITNAEFVQFHPTAIYSERANRPLVSEAIRGEGAILLTPDGERFMRRFAGDALELAPRDVVARAINTVMAEGNYDFVLLDIASQRPGEFIRSHFPQLVENANLIGIDPTKEPIPVVPAAHYFCGGIAVDTWGRTNIDQLYAIGEVSCTGLHGANRLASTSLLEGLVWGDRAARSILSTPNGVQDRISSSRTNPGDIITSEELAPYFAQLKQIMWRDVGIVRTSASLQRASNELRHLSRIVNAILKNARNTDAGIGLRNAIQTAHIITQAAQQNPVSQGTHFIQRDRVPQTLQYGKSNQDLWS